MATRLKIVMSSGSNKRTQVYYPFLSKIPGKQIPSNFPYGERYLLTGFFTYLLIHLFISKALTKERPSMFPKSRPLWKQMAIPEPYVTYVTICYNMLRTGNDQTDYITWY
jgi:hypothetical protein